MAGGEDAFRDGLLPQLVPIFTCPAALRAAYGGGGGGGSSGKPTSFGSAAAESSAGLYMQPLKLALTCHHHRLPHGLDLAFRDRGHMNVRARSIGGCLSSLADINMTCRRAGGCGR